MIVHTLEFILKKSLHRFFGAVLLRHVSRFSCFQCLHLSCQTAFMYLGRSAHIESNVVFWTSRTANLCIYVLDRISVKFETPHSEYASIGRLKKLVLNSIGICGWHQKHYFSSLHDRSHIGFTVKKSLHRFFRCCLITPRIQIFLFRMSTLILSNCVYVFRSVRAHRIERRFLTF